MRKRMSLIGCIIYTFDAYIAKYKKNNMQYLYSTHAVH